MSFLKLFKKNRETEVRLKDKEKLIKVEVALHREKTAKEIDKTKKITDNFNRVLRENGVSIHIFSAAGGKH